MKKSNKILIGGLVVAGISAAAYYAYRIFTKEVKKIEDAKKEDDAELEKLGVNPDKFRNDLIPSVDDNNLVKNMFIGVARSSNWDISVIEDALESDTPVYVTQSEFKGNRFLDLYFEIPRFNDNNHNVPKIGEYITNFERLKNEIFENLKFIERPFSKLVGFVCCDCQNLDGTFSQKFVPIPKELYSKYGDARHDGLAEFVRLIHNNEPQASQEAVDAINNGEGFPSGVIRTEFILMWKLSFKIAKSPANSDSPVWDFGINLTLAMKALNHIYNEFTIERRLGDLDYYKHFIFVPPFEEREVSFNQYYAIDYDTNIVSAYDLDLEFSPIKVDDKKKKK